MKKVKCVLARERGITLIGLIIIVVVMLIIAGVSIYNGTESLNSTRLKGFYTQLEIVQKRVDDIAATNESYIDENGEIIYLIESGSDLTEEQRNKLDEIINSLGGDTTEFNGFDFRYFTSKQIRDILGIQDIDYNLFIDFERRIIIAEQGITIGEVTYYVLPSTMYFVQKRENEDSDADDINFLLRITDIGDKKYKLSINVEGVQESSPIKYKEVFTRYWEKSNKLEIIIEKNKLPKYYDFKYEDINNNSITKSYGIYLDEKGEPQVADLIKIETAYDLVNISEQHTQSLATNKQKENINTKTTKLLGDAVTKTETDFIPEVKKYATSKTTETNKLIKIYLLMNNIKFTPSELEPAIEYWKPVGDMTIVDNGIFDGNNKEIHVNYSDDGEYTIVYNKLNNYKEEEYEFIIVPFIREEEKEATDAKIIIKNRNGEQTQNTGKQTLTVKRGLDEIKVRASMDNISYKGSEEVTIQIKNPNKISNEQNEGKKNSYKIKLLIEYNYITFTINTIPKDAKVEINNKTIEGNGTGAYSVNNIVAGRDDVSWKVSAEGYAEQSGNKAKTEITGDINVDVRLKKFVTLTINPTQSGTKVNINGEERTTITVPEGTEVTWSVEKENYTTKSGTTVITSDDKWDITLELANVILTINPTQEGAKVIINGVETRTMAIPIGSTVTWSVEKENYITKSGTTVLTSDDTWNITLDPIMVTLTLRVQNPADATIYIRDDNNVVIAQGTGTVSKTVIKNTVLRFSVEKKYYQTLNSAEIVMFEDRSFEYLTLTMNPITYASILGPTKVEGSNSDIKDLNNACSKPEDDNLRAESGTATNRTLTYIFSGFNLPADALVQGIFFRSRHGTSSSTATDTHYNMYFEHPTNGYEIFDEEVNSECSGADNVRWRYLTVARKSVAK